MANVGDKYIIEITEKGMFRDYYAGTIRLTEREVNKLEKYAPDCETVYDTGFKDVTHWQPLPEPPKGE